MINGAWEVCTIDIHIEDEISKINVIVISK